MSQCESELPQGLSSLSSNGNGNGGITNADLVSLDSIDFADTGPAEDVEVLEDNEEIDLSTLSRMREDAPVVRLVNVLLVDALRRGASDIHVEPYEKELRIRFRIDGVLYDVMHPPLKTSRRLDLARQDHVEARHFGKDDCRRTDASRSRSRSMPVHANSIFAFPLCPLSSAKRSCFVCSTKRT